MAADKHNEFIKRTVKTVGAELIDQGTFSEQMVALESLVAGLYGAMVVYGGKTPSEADTFLSALTHGVRGRLRFLMSEKQP